MSGQTVTELEGRLGLRLHHKRRSAKVVWTAGGQRREAKLEGVVVVGASPGAQVVLDDRQVSRFHAELTVDDAGVQLRDLGSRNGTWLGSTRIDRACLTQDTELRLGQTQVRVEFEKQTQNVSLWPTDTFGPLLGGSDVMRELFVRVSNAAATEAPVLLEGESGTGKEWLAREVHALSGRSRGPFVVVDCGALPESLIESELFGHVKGAFTGAVADRAGAFEEASGGTVFLDEIGELPLAMQPKLLRVLESRTIRRVGQHEHVKVDVRFVAATHRRLPQMVAEGTFREDLYFRLAVLPIRVPPLRERAGDFRRLLEHFLKGRATVSDALVEKLEARPWPGNVRELRAFAERLVALGSEQALALLEGSVVARAGQATHAGGPVVDLDVPFKDLREDWVSRLEREYLTGLFEKHGRDVSKVAELAGLDRSYVHRLIRKHGL